MASTQEFGKFKQGVVVSVEDRDFHEALQAAVDYRGDVTLQLKDGSELEGFLFNVFSGSLDVFPKDSPQKRSIALGDLNRVAFTGKDEAMGKSWEDWMKKRAQRDSNPRPAD